MVGRTISHYKIVEKMGEGGMGLVYKAQDTRLRRTVVLKVLPTLSQHSSEDRARFIQEAQLTSSLNHPNILTVHALEEVDGTSFMVTECVEGETLAVKMGRGRLRLDEILNIARQIASALAEAHGRGIVHRDLKAENIMIGWGGQVKVMDFGLARLLGSSHLTASGSLVGTFVYMSPEQINQQEVDARSDIFSFGILLYEMLTGRLPFQGETIGEILSAILTLEPSRMTSIDPNIPLFMENIVARLLEKEPARRYQSMNEVLDDLDRRNRSRSVRLWFLPRSAHRLIAIGVLVLAIALTIVAFVLWNGSRSHVQVPKLRSIAVLPFVNVDQNRDLEYLQLGLVDDIITRLSFVHSLIVRPTSASAPYEGKEISAAQAGAELQTDFVLEGRFQSSKDKITLAVQLVNVAVHQVIWGDKIELRQTEIGTLEDNLARRVVDALSIPLTKVENVQVTRILTADPEAYEYYLRGVTLAIHGSRDDYQLAMKMFERAIGLDPYFAESYASLSRAYVEYFWNNYSPDTDWVERGEEMARQALAIDDDMASAHAALGYALRVQGQYRESIAEAVRALRLDEKQSISLEDLSEFYRNRGEFDSAMVYAERIAQVDPTFNLERVKARIYQFQENYRESIPILLRAVERSPKDAWLRGGLLALSYLRLGDLTNAEKEISAAEHIDEQRPEPHLLRSMLETERGDFAAAQQQLKLISPYTESDYGLAYFVAAIYSRQGKTDKAIEWVRLAISHGNRWLSWYSSDPWFDSIRKDPRFTAQLNSIRTELDSIAVTLTAPQTAATAN